MDQAEKGIIHSMIAVVDDELDLVSLFRDALSQISDVIVFGFTDPNAALEHFRSNQEQYIMILSDLRMPGMTGIELIEKIKQLKPSTISILMSAFDVSNDQIFQESLKNKILDGFLQKPIRISDLIEEVEKQLNPTEIVTKKNET
jgi:response regulator RpfG family c-di-GMP phosphodiesterase